MSWSKTKLLALIAALLIAATLAVFRQRRHQQISSPMPATQLPAVSAGRGVTAPAIPSEQRTAFVAIQSTLDRLGATNSTVSGRDQIARLRGELEKLPRDAASAAIREFLAAKTDALTRANFRVGPDGFIIQPTTLRVFLLDYLGRIDPAAAAQYAETILSEKNSADEWAVAMRNYALGNPTFEGREYLRRKFIEMASHEPWQSAPSVGFLEAFDVAVAVGGGEVTATLAGMIRQKDNPAVAHAAFLACDRLVLAAPTETLSLLQAQPELMAGREATRANYFARANVQDAQQRQVLEQYLLDPRHTSVELETFAGLFPSANFMLSNNLLTRNPTPDGLALAKQDAAALKTVNEWLADPKFARLRPQLQKIRERLQNFARQRGNAAPR